MMLKQVAHGDAQWAVIGKTLPKTADQAHVRVQLEQIARDKSTPKERAISHERIAQLCADLIRALEADGKTELVEQLIRRGDAAKAQAAFYHQIKRPQLLRQFEILWLWQGIGGDLGYTTPRKKPGIEDPEFDITRPAAWPGPIGDVIQFFQAAWKAVSSKTLSPKRIKNIVIEYNRAMARFPSDKIAADVEVIKAT
jgi:hypothetical protein